MKIFLRKIARLNIGWNEVPLDDDAFERLCLARKVNFRLMPMNEDGFYTCDEKKHYIAVNSRLSPFQRLFTMYHEFGHYLMHSPSTDTIANHCRAEGEKTRDEKEADAFAYCALLPLDLLKSRSGEELADIYGITFFMERLAVYERYKI